MPKSVEELFDGSAFEASPEQPHEEQPAPEAQAADPALAEPVEQTQPPAPEEQAATQAASPDKGAPPAPEDSDGRDPAFGRLRKERNDYREQLSTEKVERARIEERLAARDKEFEALRSEVQQMRQAPPAPPPQAQQQHMPNPVEDPAGYAQFLRQQVVEQTAGPLLTRFLFFSEAGARRSHGDELVNAAQSWFKKEVEGKPLHAEILAQPDPWDTLVKQYQKVQALAEIGNDPAAFRAKVESEARAKYEAELRAQLAAEQPTPNRQSAPAVNLPPSLGRIPNAGDRSNAHTGPAPIEALWG